MTIYGFKDFAEAELNGQTFLSSWRKVPTQTTALGIWFDLSSSPGNPNPNFYIGPQNEFTPLSRSENGGIQHGPDVYPKTKYLMTLTALCATATPLPTNFILCDYLGFYPFIDESIIEEQFLDNTIPVPRSGDGTGVMIMPVVVAAQIGGGTFYVKYINSDGIERITPEHVITTQNVNGTIISSGGAVNNSRAPFMALQEGDKGVRSVVSITFTGAGDIGLIALVLVKPIHRFSLIERTAPAECQFFTDLGALPKIEDDAYLNLISLPRGTLAASQFLGYIKTLWV